MMWMGLAVSSTSRRQCEQGGQSAPPTYPPSFFSCDRKKLDLFSQWGGQKKEGESLTFRVSGSATREFSMAARVGSRSGRWPDPFTATTAVILQSMLAVWSVLPHFLQQVNMVLLFCRSPKLGWRCTKTTARLKVKEHRRRFIWCKGDGRVSQTPKHTWRRRRRRSLLGELSGIRAEKILFMCWIMQHSAIEGQTPAELQDKCWS